MKVEAELEGGGWYWFYVCSECRTILNSGEKICHGCKGEIVWCGLEPEKKKRPYTGEQTEPAE